MKKIAIIGRDDKVFDLIKHFGNHKDFQLKYIMISLIDIELLKSCDLIFISDDFPKENLTYLQIELNNSNIGLSLIASYSNIALNKYYSYYNDLMYYKLNKFKIHLVSRIIKRIFDFIAALILLLIFSPLLIIVAFIIKVFDKGSILYKQRRLSYKKKSFVIYKFRTMVENAEDESGVVLSSSKDERITRIGRFLRRTRLDELPQLFNVLIGDMSLVGPRPERYHYVNQFESLSPMYKFRFNTPAGITGLAQIKAHYNSNYLDKLKFDLEYIANYSLLNDLLIILKTIKFVFVKRFELTHFSSEDYELVIIKEGIYELKKNKKVNN